MLIPGDSGSTASMTHIGCQEPGTPTGDTHSPAHQRRPLARLPYSFHQEGTQTLARARVHAWVSLGQPRTSQAIDKGTQPSWKIDMVHRQLKLCDCGS